MATTCGVVGVVVAPAVFFAKASTMPAASPPRITTRPPEIFKVELDPIEMVFPVSAATRFETVNTWEHPPDCVAIVSTSASDSDSPSSVTV